MSNVVYVFIDASNLWEVQKSKGMLLDLDRLRSYLGETQSATSIEVFYYTAYPEADTREYDTAPMHKMLTFLKKGLGFHVRKKAIKQIRTDSNERGVIEKGNMDVELTIDAVHNAAKFDTAILMTGDSDFLGLVKYLRSRKKKVYAYSSKNNVSKEMVSGTDGYRDLLDIQDMSIWRAAIIRRENLSK